MVTIIDSTIQKTNRLLVQTQVASDDVYKVVNILYIVFYLIDLIDQFTRKERN